VPRGKSVVNEAQQTARGAGLGRFKPYPTYKDSGVEWLGGIPAGWQMKRLKFVAHIEAGQSRSC